MRNFQGLSSSNHLPPLEIWGIPVYNHLSVLAGGALARGKAVDSVDIRFDWPDSWKKIFSPGLFLNLVCWLFLTKAIRHGVLRSEQKNLAGSSIHMFRYGGLRKISLNVLTLVTGQPAVSGRKPALRIRSLQSPVFLPCQAHVG